MAENIQYQKVQEITDRLEQGIQELFESEKYMEWLRTMSKFHDYSLNNTLLIAFQKPDATLVAGYTAWQKQFGRQVQKGEKAIKILAPAPYKEKVEMEKIDPITQKVQLDAEGKPITEVQEVTRPAFKVVNVFDVSQTDGRELPSLGIDELSGDVREYELFFEALKRSCPVPMDFEEVEGSAKGYYHQMEQRIAIREGMSQIQTIKTAIHEMAHQRLHAVDPLGNTEISEQTRNSKEVEAESVAYTVCQHYGIDTSDYSFAYIAGWSHGKETPELKASLNTIRKTANEMINEIDGHIAEINKELEQENRITCYLKISGSMGSEYEIDRISGTAEQIEDALKEVTEKEVENVAEFLESKGIAVLAVASSIDSEPGRHINPEYEYDFDTNQIYRDGIAIGHETTREEQTLRLAIRIDAFARETDHYEYLDTVDDRDEFVMNLQNDLLEGNKNVEGIMAWFQDGMVEESDDTKEALGLVNEMKQFVEERKTEPQQEATITFYATECSEFPEMGEYHDNLTLEEAFQFYDQIPAERMNGIKGIGFELHDGSMYDGQYPLMQADRVDEELINMIDHYKESPLVQQAIADCKKILDERAFDFAKKLYDEGYVYEDYVMTNRVVYELREDGIDLWDFSTEQGKVIYEAAEKGLDVRDFAKPEFSVEQMKLMSELIEKGFDVTEFQSNGKTLDPSTKVLSEKQIADIQYFEQISSVSKEDFSEEQWKVIQRGIKERLDITQIADPNASVEDIKEGLKILRKEHREAVAAETEMSLGLQEDGRYRYYSTQRPIMPGSYPNGENKPVHIENFDERKSVESGQMQAWGYLEYERPLSAKERDAYELKAVSPLQEKFAASEQGTEKKKSVLADLHKKQDQVAETAMPGKEKKKSKEMEH